MNVRIWLTVAVAAIAAIGVNWWLGAAKTKIKVQEGLEAAADAAASLIDGDEYAAMVNQIDVAPEAFKKQAQAKLEPLVQWHKIHPDISHIYTISKTGDYYNVILDTGPRISELQRDRPDRWDQEPPYRIEDPDMGMKAAIAGSIETETENPVRNESGADLARYIPIRDKRGTGRVVGVVAATMNKRVAEKLQKEVINETIRNLLIASGIILLGFLASQKIEKKARKEKEARQRAEKQFKSLTEKLPGAVYIYSSTGKQGKGELLFASAGLQTLTGIGIETPSDDGDNGGNGGNRGNRGNGSSSQYGRARTKNSDPNAWTELVQIVPPLQRDQEQKKIIRARNQKRPWECEFQVPSTGIWLQNKATPEVDETGTTIWFGTLTDITLQKDEARRLGETNAILRKINEAPDARETFESVCEYAREKSTREALLHILFAHEEIKVVACSEVEEELIKNLRISYKAGKPQGAAAASIFEKTPTHIASIEESGLYKEAEGLKETLVNLGYKSSTIYPLYSKEGKCLGALEILDHEHRQEKEYAPREEQAAHLTLSALEKNEAMRSLEENERLYRTLFEASPLGICETDPQGQIFFSNETFQRLATKQILYALSGKNAREGRKEIQESNRTYLAESRNIEKANGKIHIITFLSDITEQKKKEEYAISSMEIAEAANKAKSEFLAVMSHEIRTPLNGVIGFSQILETRPMGEKEKGYVQKIRQSGETLLATINDILNLSKIEAGKVELEHRPFDIRQTIEITRDIVLPKAQEKGISILTKISKNVPKAILGDEVRISQILMNLAGNAVKFTEKGSVTILCDYDGKNLLTEVRDTGIGISPENQKKLFQPFSQADSSTTRKYGGTGLGLVICKKLAQLMKGNIAMKSQEGVGSRFLLRFPTQRTEKPAESRKVERRDDHREYVQLNILVAEDDEINRMVISEMLKGLGHNVEFAHDGKEVIEKANNLEGWTDVILMDMRMPEKDGIEATKYLRKEGFADLHIIALTANAMEGDRERCIEAGMNDYLSKPIIASNLKAALHKVQNKKIESKNDLKSEGGESEEMAANSIKGKKEVRHHNRPDETPTSTLTPPSSEKLSDISDKDKGGGKDKKTKSSKSKTSKTETPKTDTTDCLKIESIPIIELETLKNSLEYFPKPTVLSIVDKMEGSIKESLKILLDKSPPATEKREIAHKLCGSLGSFGCLRLEATMRNLESQYKKGVNNPTEPNVGDLEVLCTKTLTELRELIEKYAP